MLQAVGALNILERLGKAMGKVDDQEVTCEHHGKYLAAVFDRQGEITQSPCPTCAQHREIALRASKAADDSARRLTARLEEMIGRAAIPIRFNKSTFDTYLPASSAQSRVLGVCQEYADSFPQRLQDGRCLVLLGNVGNGKTHLAIAIAKQVIEGHKLQAVYMQLGELLRQFKDNYTTRGRTEREILDTFAGPDLLVIDEIGLQTMSSTDMALLYEVINARWLSMRPTVIIGNLKPEAVRKEVGDRVASRLNDCGAKVLRFDWEDYRGGDRL